MKRINYLFLIILCLFRACKQEIIEKREGATPFFLKTPAHFPVLPIPEDNPMTQEGVELGRRLYYDPLLSKDGKRSCSTCHDQKKGFTLEGTTVLPHANLGWNRHFLWNGKVQGTLEDIMLFEVEDFFETQTEVFNESEDYKSRFKQAYGVDVITHKDLAYALAQFFRTMISANAPFDQYMQNKYVFSESEYNGMMLFFTEKGDCFHCHGSTLFTNNAFHNIGLEESPEGEHLGLYEITGNAIDKGKFKTPTLRNIALRNSYMHDGRFKSLEEVIEHYNSGVKVSSTLDPIMFKNRDNMNLGLTEKEKADLVAFLKTLTDKTFVNNPALSNPFK